MSIIGIESVWYGVDDIDRNFSFWSDFGLNPVSQSASESVLETQNGARIVLCRHGDPRLPSNYAHAASVHEVIWGVDTKERFDELVAGLRTDREVRIDAEGVAHFTAEGNMPMGLKVWQPKPFMSRTDPVNTPSDIKRLNVNRQWRMKCRPKTINHIVFFTPDYVKAYEFMRDRLNFRLSDHSCGAGAFIRADGCFEHHNMFLVNMDIPIAPDKPGFMHISFSVDDIDELMQGAETMRDKGWKDVGPNTGYGVCRHRISSAIYYYCDIPSGGEAEYNADTDYIDDNWIPRAWDFKFGSLLWSSDRPDMWKGEIDPRMTLDPDGASLDAYRKG